MTDFPPLKNDLLLRTARGTSTHINFSKKPSDNHVGERVERPPVWVMRQGRFDNLPYSYA